MTWYEKHTCKINSIFIPIQIEMCVSVYEEVAFITQSHSSTLFFVLAECIIRLNCVVLSRMHFKRIDFFKYWIHVCGCIFGYLFTFLAKPPHHDTNTTHFTSSALGSTRGSNGQRATSSQAVGPHIIIIPPRQDNLLECTPPAHI